MEKETLLIQSLREREGGREGEGDEGESCGRRAKTISLAPYLTPTCIRGWGYPLLSLKVGKGDCWR